MKQNNDVVIAAIEKCINSIPLSQLEIKALNDLKDQLAVSDSIERTTQLITAILRLIGIASNFTDYF